MKKLISMLVVITLLLPLCLPGFAKAEKTRAQAAQSAGKSLIQEDKYHNGEESYQVYLPKGYDAADKGTCYPTVYLMPQDGYHAGTYLEDGIQERLDAIMDGGNAIQMIVVMPEFKEGEEFLTLLGDLVADVESKYQVISGSSQYRAILGVEDGGYMAMAATLLDDQNTGALFQMAGSHTGNFISPSVEVASGASIHAATGSSIYMAAESIPASEMKKKYYYLDAPNGDSRSTAEHSTADIGSILMKKSNPYYGMPYAAYGTPDTNYVEYTLRDGTAGKEFYLSSLERSLNRFSKKFTANIVSAAVKLNPQAVTSKDDTINVNVKWKLSDRMNDYVDVLPQIRLTTSMVNPADGAVLYTAERTLTAGSVEQEYEETVPLQRTDMAAGINTTVQVSATVLGMNYLLSEQSLVRVQDTGTKDDEQLVDLMGNWYFNAYKAYKRNDASVVELDKIENINIEAIKTDAAWDVVQPALGWWSSDFASSLGGSGNFAGYAWYVREFDLPLDFPKENLLIAVGMFDEANEVYINGTRVGSTGYDYTKGEVGVYDGSNPWDTNCVYELENSDILNYGGKNTIAVRMCNSSGGGGWYQGPVGIYSMAAYNKAAGKPSTYASSSETEQVKAVVEAQKKALEEEKAEDYKKTISADYFHSGYDKNRKMEQIQGWMKDFEEITVSDSGVGVFKENNTCIYQAKRIITGKDSQGEKTVLKQEDVSQYYVIEGGKTLEYGDHARFYVDTYLTDKLSENGEPQEAPVRVYLPEGYFEGQKRYPSAYLFHGINSTSKAFEIDKVNEILDREIANGTIKEMIVIIPDDNHPNKQSWWRGPYAEMITKDLIPAMDERYRTIEDARYRFTAGCSMGGAGSFDIGLSNPDLFSAAISFYGALSYNDIRTKTENSPADYLSRYSLYMVCGNQDNYGFYDIAGKMNRILNEKGVDNYFYIDNGLHDSAFYLPLFAGAFQYVCERMTDGSGSTEVLDGRLETKESGDKLILTYEVNASEKIADYRETIPSSEGFSFTQTTPDIKVPVVTVIMQGNKTVYQKTAVYAADGKEQWQDTLEIETPDLDLTKAYTVAIYASVLNDTKAIATKTTAADYTPGDNGSSVVNPEPVVTPDAEENEFISSEIIKAAEESGGYFYNAAGSKIVSAFVEAGDRTYAVDAKGEKLKKSLVVTKEGKKYVTTKSGELAKSKVITIADGSRYYALENGELAVSQLITAKNGKKYYAGKNSKLYISKLVTVNNDRYYASSSGKIAVSKLVKTKSGAKYYAQNNGKLAKSKWVKVGNKKYYCSKSCKITKSKKIS